MDKKGLSPVIATVLLILIVFVLASIIFLWARGFVSEGVEKFSQPVERACDRIRFEAGVFEKGVNDYDLDVNNQAEVPLYGFDIKRIGRGEVEVSEFTDKTIGSGQSANIPLGNAFSRGDEILVVPIILGETDEGRVAYTCPDENGVGITI